MRCRGQEGVEHVAEVVCGRARVHGSVLRREESDTRRFSKSGRGQTVGGSMSQAAWCDRHDGGHLAAISLNAVEFLTDG